MCCLPEERIPEECIPIAECIPNKERIPEECIPNEERIAEECILNKERISEECVPNNEDVRNFESMKKAKNILEFLSVEDIFNKITSPVRINHGEFLLMILKFSNTYMLPLSALCNMINLINTIFEHPILPESRYLIDKLFNFQNKARYHIICPNCSKYLGQMTENDIEVIVICVTHQLVF